MSKDSANDLLRAINDFIINPALLVIFATGFVVFIWGLVQFLWNPEDQSRRADGIRHLMFGVLGMFIMVSVYGIIALIVNTLGINAAAGSGGSTHF